MGESADEQTANSYLRQDYYWTGRNAQEFDATGEKYAKARNVVIYPQVKNQLISAASIDQFSNTSNKIVNGVCQKLEISDQEKFVSSKDFVAEEAVFDRVFHRLSAIRTIHGERQVLSFVQGKWQHPDF